MVYVAQPVQVLGQVARQTLVELLQALGSNHRVMRGELVLQGRETFTQRIQ